MEQQALITRRVNPRRVPGGDPRKAKWRGSQARRPGPGGVGLKLLEGLSRGTEQGPKTNPDYSPNDRRTDMRQAIMGENDIRGFSLDGITRRLRTGPENEDRQVIHRAEEEFRRRIRQDPGDAVAHYWLGVLLSAQERHEEAEKEYREVIELRKGMAVALKAG